MVFGSCHCAISNLEIKDGDMCMLLPLDFCIEASFKQNDTIENAFYVPFRFSGKPEKVRFKGNFADIEYIGEEVAGTPEWKKAQRHFEHYTSSFFMLVHIGFYHTLIENYAQEGFEKLSECRMVGISEKLYKETESQIDFQNVVYELKIKNATTQEEKHHYSNLYMNKKPPEWLIALAKVNRFMSGMGKRPAPNDAHDQHEHGKLLKAYTRLASKTK